MEPEKIKATESPIEAKLLSWMKKFHLFPTPQFIIGPYRVDFAFEDIKLVIECDGRKFHSTDEQKERDKIRDEYISGQKWKVLRFTGRQVSREPWEICRQIEVRFYPERIDPFVGNRSLYHDDQGCEICKKIIIE